jgi:hypothetical protein
MTVPSDAAQPPRNVYIEDGATLVHPINFTFVDQTEIVVSRITVDGAEHVLVNPTDYTVAGGGGLIGSITKTGGGVVGATIRIDRNTVRNQLVDREPGDDFPVEDQEAALDKVTRIVQELARDLLSREDVRDLLAALLVQGNGISITVDDAGDKITITNLVDAEFIRDTIAATLVQGNGITIAPDDVLDRIVISADGLENLPDCIELSGDQQTNNGGGAGAAPITGEQIQDAVGAMIVQGAGIAVVYDDAAGTLTITNTSPAGYTDENARDAIGAALVQGARITIAVNDAGDQITISSDALAPSYRGLAVVAEAGAFDFDDTHGGKSILYTGGPAVATLQPDATHALSDGWGTVVRNKGTGTLTITPGAGVSVMVNGLTVAAVSIALAVGAVATLNRWGADDLTLNGNSKVTST